MGVTILPIEEFLSWVRDEGSRRGWTGALTLLSMKMGRARVVFGEDIIAAIPPINALLKRDIAAELRADLRFATERGSPSNVLDSEPRRQIGYIIAACDLLLLSKGIFVEKDELPEAMRDHFPDLHVTNLLKRALDRRKNWPRIEKNARTRKDVLDDLRNFFAIYEKYLFDDPACYNKNDKSCPEYP